MRSGSEEPLKPGQKWVPDREDRRKWELVSKIALALKNGQAQVSVGGIQHLPRNNMGVPLHIVIPQEGPGVEVKVEVQVVFTFDEKVLEVNIKESDKEFRISSFDISRHDDVRPIIEKAFSTWMRRRYP